MHSGLLPHLYSLLNLVIRSLSHVLMPMFALGMAGAALVVVITFCHDLVDFFDEEGDHAMPTADNMKAS